MKIKKGLFADTNSIEVKSIHFCCSEMAHNVLYRIVKYTPPPHNNGCFIISTNEDFSL